MHRLTRSHGTLAYDLQGSGPLVVLAPGLGDLRQEYRYLAPELAAAGYRVATLDLRGHGGSSTGWPHYRPQDVGDDLLALVEHLGAPATLVGTSFAAASAVWAAAERPEAVARLVLIGPFVRADQTLPLWQRLAMRALFAGPWRVRAWDAYYASLYPSRKPEDFASYRARLRANLAEPGRFEAVRRMMFASKEVAARRTSEVAAPTLVVMGSRDPDFPDPEAEARLVAERLRGGVRMIDGAGHYPHAEMPEPTAAAILSFLSEARDGA